VSVRALRPQRAPAGDSCSIFPLVACRWLPVLWDRSGAATAVELGWLAAVGLFTQLGQLAPHPRPDGPYRRPRHAVSYVQVPAGRPVGRASGSGS